MQIKIEYISSNTKKNRLIINQEKVWKNIYSITIRFLIDEQKEEEEETTKSNAIFDI